ncbi:MULTISPECIES: EscF/YscF/HrpA family type III secretion system needle major subunit [Providencia]|nr:MULTISPECIES: EscF/YscF/HrpA family type III secretion system needle major subunit [Providencia]MBP6122368.1 type III secretion apparatus needle protein [Providencia sp.]NIH20901.1 type III secretion apparatus needle protein [Providencia heimbachae]
MATSGINALGNWNASKLEGLSNSLGISSKDAKWGMMYRSTAGMSERVKVVGDELKAMLDDKNLEVDNPLILGKITALSGNYNMARQLQSNIMKSIKDAAQAIIRNV